MNPDLEQDPRKGYAFLKAGGDLSSLAQALNAGIIRRVPSPMQVSKARGATRAFSFHWSNAQHAWDVISLKDFPWGLDGAEFILFLGRKAKSPLDRPWSLTEMRYLAKKLNPHPGATISMEGVRRVAMRWMARDSA